MNNEKTYKARYIDNKHVKDLIIKADSIKTVCIYFEALGKELLEVSEIMEVAQ